MCVDWWDDESPLARLTDFSLELPEFLGFPLLFIGVVPAVYLSLAIWPFSVLLRKLRQ